MQYYREWTSKVDRRKGRMLPISALSVIEVSFDPGYMSVYMFSAEDAYKISQQGNSTGLNRYEVYSDTLYIDIDTGEAELNDCLSKLDKEGLGYYVYTSGSKGFHVAIPLDRTYSGSNVPHSQLEWVRTRGIKCDFSIYRHGSLIAMPGRVHPKTGSKKKLVKKKDGKPASIVQVDPPKPTFESSESDGDALKIGLAQLASLSVNIPTNGNRHLSLWKCAKTLSEAGITYEASLHLLQAVNESWPAPKAAIEVERAVRSAYGT